MYDPAGRIVAAAFALVLLWLSVSAVRTGVIFARSTPYRLDTDRPAFFAALFAQIGFAAFLICVAAGLNPLDSIKSILRNGSL